MLKKILVRGICLGVLLFGGLAIIALYPPSEKPVAISSKEISAEKFLGQSLSAKKPIDIFIPEHPLLKPGGISTIHSGAWNSDVHFPSGPLGQNTQVITRKGPTLIGGMCSTTVFGHDNMLITFCGSLAGFEFQLLEPRSLTLHDRYRLPQRPSTFEGLAKANFDLMMSDTSGGAYFYLDKDNFVYFADSRQVIQKLGHRKNASGRWEFYLHKQWDLSPYVPLECFSSLNWFPDYEDCDPITAITPDHSGLIWWVTRKGRIGTLNTESGQVKVQQLPGEEIQNSFAVDSQAVYILSDHAMYAFNADINGAPIQLWRQSYDRGSARKTGVATQGSGTTPTLFGENYLTIADNNDRQAHLLVMKRQLDDVNEDRVICKVPLFKENYSGTEISMIAYNRTIIIENTFGYWNAFQQKDWTDVVGGISRVDVREDESGCDLIWHSPEISPSGVAKLSANNGLVYFYTFSPQSQSEDGSVENAWYFTALDADTGKTVYKVLTGSGSNYDVNWGPLTIGPDGTAYASARGGFISLWDKP